jgi:hypothetical protein
VSFDKPACLNVSCVKPKYSSGAGSHAACSWGGVGVAVFRCTWFEADEMNASIAKGRRMCFFM